MSIVVTGSIAFDYLMSFPGKFTEHFLPEHMNRVSLSFLVDTMDKRRGGCAPNIAYTLALLGERPLLMATAGEDFGEYRQLARGGRRRHVARHAGRRQVHRVVLLQHRHREQPDRVVLHRRDGRRRGTVVSDGRATAGWRSSRRTIPARWCSTPRNAARSASRSSSIPGQQCARMSGDELRDGIDGRDHRHLQRLRVRADTAEDRRSSEADILEHSQALDHHEGRARVIDLHAGRAGRRAGGDADAHRRPHRRRRRVPRRVHEGHRARAVSSRRSARGWAAWPRPTRSSTSAARATPTLSPSSTRDTKRTSVGRFLGSHGRHRRHFASQALSATRL